MPIRSYSQASASAPFTFRLGASSSPKAAHLKQATSGENFFSSSLITGSSSSFFSSTKKLAGEDAFFMSHVASSNKHVMFGIADGVGGWQESGIDPSHFSQGLCKYMGEGVARPEKQGDLRPKNLLQKAFDLVLKDKSVVAGGSTACVATVEPKGMMEVANLGDSGFTILQPGKIAYKSEPQLHAFNTPYQLSKMTPKMQAQQSIFGGSAHFAEQPQQSHVSTHQLRTGDVMVCASDGVWDNLSPMDVLGIVQPLMERAGYWTASSSTPSQSGTDSSEALVNAENLSSSLGSRASGHDEDVPALLAYAIMRQAKVVSHDMKRDGPFAKEVQRYYPGEEFHGGKVDDISVVVCIAVQDNFGPGTGLRSGDWKTLKSKL